MFICNVSLNKKKLFKIFFIFVVILVLILFAIGIYKIVIKANSTFNVNDSIKSQDVVELTSNNYTDVLKAVHENIDSYVGIKIHFSGYVYRLIDFEENQFVLARNMIISSDYQSVIVGFLCESNQAKNFENNAWVEITGTITKGNYHGDMPIIKISEINSISCPNDEYVYPPDDSYLPTNSLL
jgi:uncharacterized repeat protein (TIGR03943 family)